ncbi:hypothetical protein RND81_06G157900 [Saponaria officinalis]|uniref:Transposase n=1 Tax=Saponaria officinalis TaxID=3572 RepID=A0AAW1KC62_SAPOF
MSCYESMSVQSDDYFDCSINIPGRTNRLVTAQNLVFDPITMRRELAIMILLHEYPLSIIHHVGFRSFLSSINPLFKIVSQETVWNDIMKIRKFERCIAISELGSPSAGRVAITTKMWVSCDGTKKYLAITGHMVDYQWERQSYIMRFSNVPVRCTNESIADVLLECLSEFDVDIKLSTITFDNQTSDDELTDTLRYRLTKTKFLLGGKLFKLPCFAHTVCLMVQDVFDVMRDVINKIRDSILFWTESQDREAEFKKAARDLGLNTAAALLLDHDSNWSSTFLMMKQSTLLVDVFVHLKQQESRYNSLPTYDEWYLVSEVCKKLEELHDVILRRITCTASTN